MTPPDEYPEVYDDPRGSNTAAFVLLGAAVTVAVGLSVYAVLQARAMRAELRDVLAEPTAAPTTTQEQPAAAPPHTSNGRPPLQPEIVLTPEANE